MKKHTNKRYDVPAYTSLYTIVQHILLYICVCDDVTTCTRHDHGFIKYMYLYIPII